ncbi:hypothetical protein B0H16DRAFT_1878578 [Mycena metata]|uniref:Uncharacterized protein n=1 Tax=Mycena metata TaxID=1033252 RepID=A0AAD7KAC5_9AGAR|nr:hypothetical protein B0H16DRAFT_1878578 [Mycena metata]
MYSFKRSPQALLSFPSPRNVSLRRRRPSVLCWLFDVLASSVGFSAVPQSTISRTFLSRLPPRHSSYFGITSVAGPYASLSTVLQCEISPLDSTDFVLGLDWVSMICEHLLRNDYRLDDSFDPWAFFTQAVISTAGPCELLLFCSYFCSLRIAAGIQPLRLAHIFVCSSPTSGPNSSATIWPPVIFFWYSPQILPCGATENSSDLDPLHPPTGLSI